MRLFLVRHVNAGRRSQWKGDDRLRPASKSGRRQADAIATRLAPEGVSTLLSSPYVRCQQSLEPLGTKVGLPVVHDERLAEGAAPEGAIAIVVDASDGTVVCTHGDIIGDLITLFVRWGMELTTVPDWRKAALWVLEGPGGEQGFTTAAVEPPPPKLP